MSHTSQKEYNIPTAETEHKACDVLWQFLFMSYSACKDTYHIITALLWNCIGISLLWSHGDAMERKINKWRPCFIKMSTWDAITWFHSTNAWPGDCLIHSLILVNVCT